MSQYTIDYSCGHSGSKNICGKQSERQGKADWYAQGVCEDCYKAKKQAERDETNKVAAEELKGFDLPVLVGSEKQIIWATTIRVKMWRDIEAVLPKFQRNIEAAIEKYGKEAVLAQVIKDGYTGIDEALDKIRASCEKIKSQTSASYWIDHRDDTLQQMVKVS